MRFTSRDTLAKLGIVILLLALIRSLSEYFRLKYIYHDALTITQVEPFITGSLLTAVCVLLAVALFFAKKYTVAIIVAIATVLVLLVYKAYISG